MAARTHDLQAIDGPYLQIRDVDGFRAVARRSAALGFDGKWVLHPGQIDAANEVYSPAQADYDHAELILDAYELLHVGGRRQARRGHARRRDDRRGLPQDGAGDRRQGPGRRHVAHDVVHAARRLSRRRRATPSPASALVGDQPRTRSADEERAERGRDPADDDAGQGHSAAGLLAVADLPPGDVTEDRADDAQQPRRRRSRTASTSPTIDTTIDAIASAVGSAPAPGTRIAGVPHRRGVAAVAAVGPTRCAYGGG